MRSAALIVTAVVVYTVLIHFLRPTFPVHRGGVVVVTGASTGIGHDAAVALDKAGYTVFAGVRRQADADGLRAEGSERMRPIILDVTSPSDIESAVRAVEEHLKASGLPLAGLVNNAGLGHDCPLEFSLPHKVRQVFEVNVFGLLDITRAFIPLLRESRGRIVNIGSFAGLVAPRLFSIYSGTKFAVSGISDSLRRELLPHGVSVSEVNPAYVDTPIQTKGGSSSQHLTEEQRKLYDFDQFERAMERSFELSDTTQVTNEAIVDAIVSPKPLARYVVANVDGVPAWLMAKVAAHIPVELMDFLVRFF